GSRARRLSSASQKPRAEALSMPIGRQFVTGGTRTDLKWIAGNQAGGIRFYVQSRVAPRSPHKYRPIWTSARPLRAPVGNNEPVSAQTRWRPPPIGGAEPNSTTLPEQFARPGRVGPRRTTTE